MFTRWGIHLSFFGLLALLLFFQFLYFPLWVAELVSAHSELNQYQYFTVGVIALGLLMAEIIVIMIWKLMLRAIDNRIFEPNAATLTRRILIMVGALAVAGWVSVATLILYRFLTPGIFYPLLFSCFLLSALFFAARLLVKLQQQATQAATELAEVV